MIDKKKYPLFLSANIKSWGVDVYHGTELDKDPRMLAVRKEILERDNFTCQYCSFQSGKYQEIHHLDGDHNNFNKNNLVTVCPLCHQVHHIDSVSLTRGGYIGIVPELSQESINLLFAYLFICKEVGDEKYASVSKSLINQFEQRVNLMNVIMPDSQEPVIFAEMLLRSPKDFYAQRTEKLKAFKLIPSHFKFEDKHIKYWASKYDSNEFKKWEENFNFVCKKLDITTQAD